MERTLTPLLDKVIANWQKMAFLSGPRQVGKTTLAKKYAGEWGKHIYFNWDDLTDQKKLIRDPYFFEKTNREGEKPVLVIFDEIHKFARWKNYLKGVFDKYHEEFRFLVTGSGRLDLFKKGGDSLLGRYFSLPLFPLTVGEIQSHFPTFAEFKTTLEELPTKKDSSRDIYLQLFSCSGFPDPFLKASADFYTLWFKERKRLLMREDIRDASNIREISLLEMLSHLLPERIGSPLSINSLKEDVGVAFETVRDWLALFNAFYYSFSIQPFFGSLKRTLRKESKFYLFDWVEIENEAFRFENVVALHLSKAVQTWNATGEGIFNLHYLRDKEKREVDFLIAEKKKPIMLIECKWKETDFSPALLYYQQKLKIPVVIQLTHQIGVCQKRHFDSGIGWLISADHWLQTLP